MFFAPPEVKSLSQYSEFGPHMGERQFLAMVGLAALLHAAFMWVYSLSPHERAMIIPVRVLNIKLNAGSGELQMPKLSDMPGYVPPAPVEAQPYFQARPEAPKSMQAAADKIYNSNKQKTLVSILTQNTEKRKTAPTGMERLLSEKTPIRPHKYVREGSIADKNSKAQGNGSSIEGSQYGMEIVRNYEQEISLWMAKHKNYPEAAKQQGVEGNAVVRIRISRDGHIIYSAVDVSSGNTMIDEAAMAMVRDSDPVPRVPDNYPDGRELEFLIPVSFKLK